MSVEITIDVSEAVRKLDPAKMEEYVTRAVGESIRFIVADVKQYPAPVPDSPYIRTKKLGQDWSNPANVKLERMRASVGNTMGYAPYVQDAAHQARIHRGRWQTIQQVALRQAPTIKRFIEAALARWAR